MSIRIISFLVFVTFLILFFLSRNEKIEQPRKVSALFLPFYKSVVFLSYRFHGYWRLLFKSEKVKSCLRMLYPGQKVEKSCHAYYLSKFSFVFLILFFSSFFSLFLSIRQDSKLKDNNTLLRGSYEENSTEVTLRVIGQKEASRGTLKLEVTPQRYTQEELEQIYREFLPILEKEILGNNQSADKIQKDMNLATALREYPFTVEWSTSNYALMHSDGGLQKSDIAEEGELLKLTAIITYEGVEEFQKIYECFVRVYPPDLSAQEKFMKEVTREVEKSNAETLYQSEWKLPEEVLGEPIFWEEKEVSKGVWILGMSCIAAIVVFFQKDQDLKKQVKKREQEMLKDYSAVISRLTLYLNAGMTIKGAWKKAAEGKGGKNRHGVYEQMQLTCYEMDSGIAEVNAYERFGKRCALQPYIKLAALLSQNLKKGNSILLERLKEETQLALLERKNKVRTLAEEAGTKLLLPMMLMMAVVMIFIMVPAFSGF